jgi:DNA-directed RNA polymerase specialized sigma24 family protein
MWRAARRVLNTDDRSAGGVSVADVVQGVMTNLMAKPAGQGIPPGTENIAGFLYVATRRAALNAVAKEKRAREDPLPERGHPRELPTEEDFEEGIDDALICEQLDAVIHLLTEEERYAYVERFKLGRSLVEIGAGLGGKSDSWAARVCTRALRKPTVSAGIEADPRPQRKSKEVTNRKEGNDE